MKIVELIIAGKNERFLLRAPSQMMAADIIKAILDYLSVDELNGRLYHIESGRFLLNELSIADNNVETGDKLLILI